MPRLGVELDLVVMVFMAFSSYWGPTLEVPIRKIWTNWKRSCVSISSRRSSGSPGPRDARRHATLGMVYAANSIWPKLVWHSETLQLDPKEPLAQLYFAVATQETGDFDEALKLYRQVTVRFPDFAPALTGWVTSQAGAVMKQKTCFVV